MGMVQNRRDKLRLILDATYLNCCLRYLGFTHEKLQVAINQLKLKKGIYMVTAESQSGHQQMLIHP